MALQISRQNFRNIIRLNILLLIFCSAISLTAAALLSMMPDGNLLITLTADALKKPLDFLIGGWIKDIWFNILTPVYALMLISSKRLYKLSWLPLALILLYSAVVSASIITAFDSAISPSDWQLRFVLYGHSALLAFTAQIVIYSILTAGLIWRYNLEYAQQYP